MKDKKRVVYYDILNIIAIIAVIALHCNGIVHRTPNVRAWNTSLIVECLFYFAVPLFCMLSGATLMRYREKYDTKTFFQKRFLKVLIPFLFWSVFMFVWRFYKGMFKIEEFSSIKDWINAFWTSKQEPTYYFMFEILGLYLTIPVLSLLAKDENKKTLWLTVFLFFIFNGLIPNILAVFEIAYNYSLSVRLSGYVIYVILGYLLSSENISKKNRIIVYIGTICGLIYRYAHTFIYSKELGYVVKTTWSYTGWHCMLLAISVFVFIKNMNFDKILNEKVSNTIAKISSCSFGIYLIHQLVIHYEVAVFNVNWYSWQWRTIGVVTTYIISLIAVYIMKKIPIVKRIVP